MPTAAPSRWGASPWRGSLQQTFEIAEQIRRSGTAEDVCECLLRYTSRFGVTRLLCGLIPPPGLGRQDQRAHVLLEAWPAEWSQQYFASGYLYRDPTISLVKSACNPFVWSEIEQHCKVGPLARRIMQEAAEFRLREGLTFSFSSIEGWPIGFSLAGERFELDPRHHHAIQFASAYALARALEIARRFASHPTVHLSSRQRDVLLWASEGLTVAQIAERLGVTSHTVDMHLRLVRFKLGVTTTVQAVAEAFRSGLII